MAAITRVFTIRRAAEILGRDEDLLWDISDQLDPEDGKLLGAQCVGADGVDKRIDVIAALDGNQLLGFLGFR